MQSTRGVGGTFRLAGLRLVTLAIILLTLALTTASAEAEVAV